MFRNIVFDLDGTLWHTGNIYIYAYHCACNDYGITDRLSDEEVVGFLAANYEELMEGLFPWAADDPEFMTKALFYWREFTYKNPDKCLFPGIKEFLQNISKDYSIYLATNCPTPFAELFLDISESRELFTGIYTIEDGKKVNHLKKISATGKTLFVGDSPSDRNATLYLSNVSFCWAAYGYSKCILYDYKINSPQELLTVINKLKGE